MGLCLEAIIQVPAEVEVIGAMAKTTERATSVRATLDTNRNQSRKIIRALKMTDQPKKDTDVLGTFMKASYGPVLPLV